MNIELNKPIAMGHYTLTPASVPNLQGSHQARVSIRSGQGSTTSCRMLTFSDCHATPEVALHHAILEGQHWVRTHGNLNTTNTRN